MNGQVDILTLKQEVSEVIRRHPSLSADNAFVLWFVHSALVEDEKLAKDAVLGGSGDKGIDALFIDHPNRKVLIVQGKYRLGEAAPLEGRSDLIAFANLGSVMFSPPAEHKKHFETADELVKARALEANGLLRRRDYDLELYFVTSGKVSTSHEDDARGVVSGSPGTAELTILGRTQILGLLRDYLEGAAPSVPFLNLPLQGSSGIIKRVDPDTGIQSWIFSMLGSDVGNLYSRTGVRLFSRNIRGFLGRDTDINKSMRFTLKSCPQNFWYYNNGVTLVCSSANRADDKGKEILKVYSPQVINGQQTTRMLSEFGNKRSSVLVRVIVIPREGHNGTAAFEQVVGSIVQATNWQNEIKSSDLRSNDSEQVRLERELRRVGYQYLRKRQSKGEIRRIYGVSGWFQIKKEDLAKAVTACERDPSLVRLGTETLFEEEHYNRIFDGRLAKEYLLHIHLDRIIRYGAHGKPEWGYSRWLVLHHAWKTMASILSLPSNRAAFLHACEHDGEEWILAPLRRWVFCAYRAANAFYKANRGKGDQAADVSTFHKRVGLHTRFESFFKSARNRKRALAGRSLKKFIRVLKEAAEE